MQIKSWQIAILSIPLAIIFEIYRYSQTTIALSLLHAKPSTEFFLSSLLIVLIILSIPIVLLYIEKTKKIGAVLAIITGIFIIVSDIIIPIQEFNNYFNIIKLIPVYALVLVFAGIYYFKKERSISNS